VKRRKVPRSQKIFSGWTLLSPRGASGEQRKPFVDMDKWKNENRGNFLEKMENDRDCACRGGCELLPC
jgi:hypothetical protein